MPFASFIDKLVDFGLEDGEFKNDKGETISYKTVVARVEIDGEVEDLPLSGSNALKPKVLNLMLKSAKTIKKQGTILEDD